MLRKFGILLYILVMCFTSLAQNQSKVKYDYLLYTPSDYEQTDKNYPLLIYLHGGSQRGTNLNKLKTYGIPAMIAQGTEFPFIIACPQCPKNKYWSSENWCDSLYTELLNKYSIDTNRVYLTGISMGGYGTFITALNFPKRFAAIMPLCGGINDSDTSRISLLKNIPIWAFHGAKDSLIDIQETRRIVDALNNENQELKFTEIPEEGHYIQYIYETKPEIYDWLLKFKKGK